MKICIECNGDLPLAQFHKGGPNYWHRRCKACTLKRARGHRASRRTRPPAGEPTIQVRIGLLDAYKFDRGCIDCQGVDNLEFDHLPGREKLFTISQAARSHEYPMLEIWAEVEKCEVVCRACHNSRTGARRRGEPVDELREPSNRNMVRR